MKVDYMHKLSKTTGDAVLKELLQFKVPTEPKSKSAKFLIHIQTNKFNYISMLQVTVYICMTQLLVSYIHSQEKLHTTLLHKEALLPFTETLGK